MEYFKYLAPARTDVLKDLKVRFTQAAALNDPFESFPAIVPKNEDWFRTAFAQRIQGEIQERGISNVVARAQYQQNRQREFDQFYAMYSAEDWQLDQVDSVVLMDSVVQGYLSLSATKTNILMWSHYAQNHEGYALGFNAKHEYLNRGVQKVIYSDQRPFLDPTQPKQDASLFYTKSTDWSYEREYRKIQGFVEPIDLPNGNTLLPFPDQVPSVDDPELFKVRLFDFPKEAISSVVFGWRSSDDLQQQVVSHLLRHGLTQIPVFQAIPHSTKYEMKLEELDIVWPGVG